jgi:hypothetical protein
MPIRRFAASHRRLARNLVLGGILAAAVFACGCRSSKSKGNAALPEGPITYRPLDGSVGRVMSINERLRFVVLDYTLNTIPPAGTRLLLYRSTNLVGALKLTSWRSVYTAAADILEGAPQLGDEARLE